MKVSFSDRRAWLLTFLLGLSLIRGLVYSAVIPPWQSPDEPGHFEYARLLYQKGGLISLAERSSDLQEEIIASMDKYRFWEFVDWAEKGEMGGELWQPPLYYLLCALTLFFTAQEDMITQLYAMRLVSVLMGTMVILLAYISTRTLFPDDLFLQIGVPSFILFLPMQTYMISSVNNDNLAVLMTSLTIYLVTLSLKRGVSLSRMIAIGLSLLLGFYAKRTFFFVVPLTLLAIPIALWMKPPKVTLWQRMGMLICVAGITTGTMILWQKGILLPWWKKVYQSLTFSLFYADLDPPKMFRALQGLYPLYSRYIFESFWAYFGWLTVRLDSIWYNVILAACLASLVGAFIFGFKVIKGSASLAAWQKAALLLYLLSVFFVLFIAVFTYLGYETELAFLKGHMPQGRYLFPAIIPIATIFMLGIRELVPSRYRLQQSVLCLIGFFLFDLICLVNYIVPSFYAKF